MPFRIPTSRSPSAVNRSCSPNPPSAVRSSSAWEGLTVTTTSEWAMPPLSAFIRPYHSNTSGWYSSTGRPNAASVTGERGAEVYRRQRRVPVVGVQQLRLRRDLGKGRERRQTEEREPPVVVRIVPVVVAVDARPVEKVGMLDEEDLRTGSGRASTATTTGTIRTTT